MPPGSCRRLRRWHACICAVAERLGGGTELGGVIDVLILNARHRWVPLHLAAAYGHLEIVEQLQEAGADLCATTNGGLTAMDWAKAYGYVETAEVSPCFFHPCVC